VGFRVGTSLGGFDGVMEGNDVGEVRVGDLLGESVGLSEEGASLGKSVQSDRSRAQYIPTFAIVSNLRPSKSSQVAPSGGYKESPTTNVVKNPSVTSFNWMNHRPAWTNNMPSSVPSHRRNLNQ